MNFYPAEVVTPPLALVALLGRPELHGTIMEYFKLQKPPVNSIGVADPLSASRLFTERKGMLTAPAAPLGIFKAEWFAKHRQRQPAVAVVFLDRDSIGEDPTSWSKVTNLLETVRNAVRQRAAKTVLALVQTPQDTALSEDTALTLCRQAGVDRRQLVSVSMDSKAELRTLYRTVVEQAALFYSEQTIRVMSKYAEKRQPSHEVSVRTYLKAAAFSEFRGEWGDAMKKYHTSYQHVRDVMAGPIMPMQRFMEILAVAEVIHLKIITLLIHQHRVPEALSQFSSHLSHFRNAPLRLPPPLRAAHAGWLARQHQVMGDKLNQLGDGNPIVTQRDSSPATFYLYAALWTITRREAAHEAAAAGVISAVSPGSELVPAQHLGQWLLKDADQDVGRRMVDEEFVAHLQAEETFRNTSYQVLELLGECHEMYKRSTIRATRLMYRIGALMGIEQLVNKDMVTAKKLLEAVAGVYRKELWELPLASTLTDLLQASEALALSKDAAAIKLELASLPSANDPLLRLRYATSGLAHLLTPTQQQTTHTATLTDNSNADDAPEAPLDLLAGGAAGAKEEEAEQQPPSGYCISQSDMNLANCVVLCYGFVPPKNSEDDLLFGVAFWNNLPVAVPVSKLEIVVDDGEGTLTVGRPLGMAPCTADDWQKACDVISEGAAAQDSSPIAVSSGEGGVDVCEEEGGSDGCGRQEAEHVVSETSTSGTRVCPTGSSEEQRFVMPPSAWYRLTFKWTPRCSGSVRVVQLILHMGSQPSLTWNIPSFTGTSMPVGHPFGGFASTLPPFTDARGIDIGRGAVDVPVRHTAPVLDVDGLNFAVQGETLPVQVSVQSHDALYNCRLAIQAKYSEGDASVVWELQPSDSSHTIEDTSSGAQLFYTAQPASSVDTTLVVMQLPRAGEVSFLATLTYTTSQGSSVELKVQQRREVVVEPPFRLSCRALTASRIFTVLEVDEQLQHSSDESHPVLPVGESCVFTTHIRASPPCQLELCGMSIECDPSCSDAFTVEDSTAHLLTHNTQTLRRGDVFSAIWRVRCSAAGIRVPVGHLKLHWRRPSTLGGEAGQLAETLLPLPHVSWCPVGLLVRVTCPPHIMCGEHFDVQLDITNTTRLLHKVSLTIGDSHGFVISGSRSSTISLLPQRSSVVAWRLVAYAAGSLRLPDIQCSVLRYNRQMALTENHKVFVFPARPHSDSTLDTSSSSLTPT